MVRITHSSLIRSRNRNEAPQQAPPDGLYSLFILRESGCPFFYRIYDAYDNYPDPAILGGFFIALSLFAKEVTTGQLETITTGPCRYSFYSLHGGLLVICSAKNFNPLILEKIAKHIAQLFLTKYSDKLTKPLPAALCAPDLGQRINRIFEETASELV
ncbi:MAG: hypothetical protein ACFFD8_01610 [Candidatus Thorarchaeota archaeon]